MEENVEIEIIDIVDHGHRFVVEYEVAHSRERVKHGFPKQEGWEIEDAKGVPKFIRHLRKLVAKKECCRKEQKSVQDFSKKFKGTKLSISSEEAD